MLLPKVKISISDAYFFDAQTMADFFNRIDQKQTLTCLKTISCTYPALTDNPSLV
jgi:hypothetical protein